MALSYDGCTLSNVEKRQNKLGENAQDPIFAMARTPSNFGQCRHAPQTRHEPFSGIEYAWNRPGCLQLPIVAALECTEYEQVNYATLHG